MLSNEKMHKSKFYLILIFTSLIILSISIESLIRVKDISIFESWIKTNNISLTSDYELDQAFNSYISFILTTMFLKLTIPMALSIHSYFAYTRIRINKLFVFIWTVLLLGGLAYEIVGFNIVSVFFYINIITYIILIITINSLSSDIDKSK